MPALLAALALASSVPMTFAFEGCEALSDHNKASVDTLAKVMRDPRFGNFRFVVEGHAARTGDRAEELAISERLATEVMRRLIEYGVRSDHLAVRGYGADRPLPGELPEDYANCRVELVRN